MIGSYLKSQERFRIVAHCADIAYLSLSLLLLLNQRSGTLLSALSVTIIHILLHLTRDDTPRSPPLLAIAMAAVALQTAPEVRRAPNCPDRIDYTSQISWSTWSAQPGHRQTLLYSTHRLHWYSGAGAVHVNVRASMNENDAVRVCVCARFGNVNTMHELLQRVPTPTLTSAMQHELAVGSILLRSGATIPRLGPPLAFPNLFRLQSLT